jgi:hypothetical protein
MRWLTSEPVCGIAPSRGPVSAAADRDVAHMMTDKALPRPGPQGRNQSIKIDRRRDRRCDVNPACLPMDMNM